jgi:DNA-binding transcriptional MerR regulator
MLPILIMPDFALEPEEETPHESIETEIELDAIRELCDLLPQAGRSARVPLGPWIEIRHPVPPVTQASDAPASLHACEQLLKLLLRRRADLLGHRRRAELRRFLCTTTPASSSIATLSPATVTWLLWAMNWRGISTPRQLVSPSLHAPTLVVQWWTSMPTTLCLGPAPQLLRVLADCAARSYQVWQRVVKRMRAARGVSLDSRMVRIKFMPLTPNTNSMRGIDYAGAKTSFADLVCANLPTNDRFAA